MDVFADFLNQIADPAQRARTQEVLSWTARTYPQLERKIAWKQPMFTDHGTFIIGFSVAKHHLAVAPERAGIVHFSGQIMQAGYDKNGPTTATQQGIEVVREYHDANDQPLKTVHVGDDVIVHVRVRATDNTYHDNVAILDLLPGGFDVARDSVTTGSMDYVDIREDRVIFFGSVDTQMKEMIYKMKATTVGQFSVPGAFAKSMYNPMIHANGVASQLTVAPQTEGVVK